MINPLTPRLSTPFVTGKSSRRQEALPGREDGKGSPRRADASGLAASIQADGGLAFLRSRLEDQLGRLFSAGDVAGTNAGGPGPEVRFENGNDPSPAATADRIVSFALGLHDIFSRQHADLPPDEIMDRFETEIRRGINEGFGHARDVLGELDQLSDPVESQIDATWGLVQGLLDEFFAPEPVGAA